MSKLSGRVLACARPGNDLSAYLIGVGTNGDLFDVDVTTIGNNAVLSDSVDLDENGVWENTVDEAIQAAHVEIDSTIYNYDGTLTDDRDLDGNNFYLRFTNLTTFQVSGDDIDLDAREAAQTMEFDDLPDYFHLDELPDSLGAADGAHFA